MNGECATWEPVQAAIVAVLSHRVIWWLLVVTALVTLWLVIDAAFKITEWGLNMRAKKKEAAKTADTGRSGT